MIQVELVMRGPVRGEDVEGAKIRKVWVFRDLSYMPSVGIFEEMKAEFYGKLWTRIIEQMNVLGIKDVYGITIASIIDMSQIYP